MSFFNSTAFKLSAVVIILNVVVYLALGWLGASAVTSIVKAATDKCGIEYGIEDYGVAGDWFCADKK